MAEFRSEGRRDFGGRSEGRSFGNRDGGRSFGRRDGGRGGFGGGRSFGDRDSGRFERRPVTMHSVICDKCKKSCTVPFKPSGDKPVYCSECFAQNAPRDGFANARASFNSRESFGSKGNDRPAQSGMSSEQFNQINLKLDKILALLATLEIDDSDDSDELIEDLDEIVEESPEDAKKAKMLDSSDESEDLDADSDEDMDKD